MSKTGIEKMATVFTLMQRIRNELLRISFSKGKLVDRQNLLLAQLLLTGKDSMKEEFAKITLMKESER